MPRISKQEKERNRRRIVDSASAQFRVKGVDGTGIEEVMRAAGMTHGGFYNHFGSKDDLAVEVYRDAFSVYAATKATLRSLVRNWAVDLKGTGIRVNIVSPGPVATPALLGLGKPGQEQQTLEVFSKTVPLGRVAHPDEIAKIFAFVASEDASFMHGAEVFVDGGKAQV